LAMDRKLGLGEIKYPRCTKKRNKVKVNPDHFQITDEVSMFTNLVNRFAQAMVNKFHGKYLKGAGGWFDESNSELLDHFKEMLKSHIEKGDMVDVANFAVMIWNLQDTPPLAALEANGVKEEG